MKSPLLFMEVFNSNHSSKRTVFELVPWNRQTDRQ